MFGNKNITLQKPMLIVSFLLIIGLFISFGTITIKGLFTLGNLTRTIYEHPLVVSNASLIAALNMAKMHRNLKNMLTASSSDEVEAALTMAAENEHIVYQQLDIVRDRILGAEGQALEKETRQLFIDWKPILEEIIQLLKSGKTEEAVPLIKTKGADHVRKLELKAMELSSYARRKADTLAGLAEARQAKLEKASIVLTIIGVLISILIAFIATYLVAKTEKQLKDEKDKLQKAFAEIKTLRGVIPICSHCKKIRDDKGSWSRLEEYIRIHSEAEFTHGICPDCVKKYHPQYYKKQENS